MHHCENCAEWKLQVCKLDAILYERWVRYFEIKGSPNLTEGRRKLRFLGTIHQVPEIESDVQCVHQGEIRKTKYNKKKHFQTLEHLRIGVIYQHPSFFTS